MPYELNQIQRLYDERRDIGEQIKTIYARAEAEKRSPTAEENAELDKLIEKGEDLLERAKRMERASGVTDDSSKRTAPAPDPAEVVEAPAAGPTAAETRAVGSGPRDTTEYRDLFNGFLQSTDPVSAFRAAEKCFQYRVEHRDLQTDNDTQAGVLVPPEQFVAELIKDFDSAIKFRGWARTFTLRKARSLGAPKRTARLTSAAWGAEIAAPTADTTLAYGKRVLFPGYLSILAKVSKDLLRSAAMPVDSMVREEMVYAGGALMETGFFTGSGVGQPLGIFTASSEGISTARDITSSSTTEVKFQDLLDAKFSIKEQYEPALRWTGRRAVKKQLYGMRDSEGRPIFLPSYVTGTVDRVMEHPFEASEFAPAVSSGNYVLILGDFSNYWIADALDLEFQLLSELYALTNQVGYLARAKTDGMPVKEEAFARIALA